MAENDGASNRLRCFKSTEVLQMTENEMSCVLIDQKEVAKLCDMRGSFPEKKDKRFTWDCAEHDRDSYESDEGVQWNERKVRGQ